MPWLVDIVEICADYCTKVTVSITSDAFPSPDVVVYF
jgi:hypothetical protein